MKYINELLCGDAISILKNIPDESMNTCVTSPPYYALRDYHMDGQIGMEKTPELYVEQLVKVFTEINRVLRDDGTLWLNIGDSYCGYKGINYENRKKSKVPGNHNNGTPHTAGVKNKDLIGIPWMVAFALRQSGWYLRQDIIWSKPNPMPESVKDRCTKSHEYIFLLSKSPKYYYDADSIKEPCVNLKLPGSNMTNTKLTHGSQSGGNKGLIDLRRKYNSDGLPEYRNKRSVWNVPVLPYKGAHFATFPIDLIRDCILAGCPEDGIVIDPFVGSGTTPLVALQNNRKFVGIDLNPDYIEIAKDRISLWKYDSKYF